MTLSQEIQSILSGETDSSRLAFWLSIQRDFFCCIVSAYNEGATA